LTTLDGILVRNITFEKKKGRRRKEGKLPAKLMRGTWAFTLARSEAAWAKPSLPSWESSL